MSGDATGREVDRSAYRAFVRANHPDAGGDPETFITGMRAFGEMRDGGTGRPDRFHAPIVVVRSPTGLHRVTHHLRRWWRRRTAPARVR